MEGGGVCYGGGAKQPQGVRPALRAVAQERPVAHQASQVEYLLPVLDHVRRDVDLPIGALEIAERGDLRVGHPTHVPNAGHADPDDDQEVDAPIPLVGQHVRPVVAGLQGWGDGGIIQGGGYPRGVVWASKHPLDR